MMRIAVMALQGAFIEHEHMLQRLGAETFEIRQLSDWQQHKDGLIMPGGESTTMAPAQDLSCWRVTCTMRNTLRIHRSSAWQPWISR